MAKTWQAYKKDFGVGVVETEASGAVFWCVFGSSGHQTSTQGVPNLQFGVPLVAGRQEVQQTLPKAVAKDTKHTKGGFGGRMSLVSLVAFGEALLVDWYTFGEEMFGVRLVANHHFVR